MSRRLAEARILVPRPEAQARALCECISAEGGIPIRAPAMAIEALPFPDGGFTALTAAEIVIVTSANAARGLSSARAAMTVDTQVLAIGRATAEVLRNAEIDADPDIDPQSNSEALLASPVLAEVEGTDIVIVKGEGGRPLLWRGLKARGAEVTELILYRRGLPETLAPAFQDALVRGVDIVVGTSVELVENMLELAGELDQETLTSTCLVAGGERVLQQSEALGFSSSHNLAAVSPEDQAILEGLCLAWAKISEKRG
jgi:uroporphyrinogen-III synthase